MMRFDFSQNCWNAADFLPAASVRVPYRLAFGQKDDCIHNEGADKAGDEYAYVSMALAQRVKAPCLLSTECAFNKYGAPLILLADEIIALPDGRRQYGHHIEIVGWEKGLNLWDITPDPAADHGQRVKKIGALSFPVKGGERFEIFVRVGKASLTAGLRTKAGAAEFDCPCRLADSFYAGLTACEGENYFYNFVVE